MFCVPLSNFLDAGYPPIEAGMWSGTVPASALNSIVCNARYLAVMQVDIECFIFLCEK